MKFISPLFSDARASVGGATFSKNRGGNYVRSKVAPVQPRSVAQQSARANLALFSGQWKGLTATQRAGWAGLAAGITLKDTLGNSYTPTGSQLFVGLNRNLTDIVTAPITTAPSSVPNFPEITPLVLTASSVTPAIAIATALAAAPTGFLFLVKATGQLSPGISYVGQSKYRIIGAFPASAFASINILTAYTARWGTLRSGQKVQVAVSLVQASSGFQSLQNTATVNIT
jgi:hypothetical protein